LSTQSQRLLESRTALLNFKDRSTKACGSLGGLIIKEMNTTTIVSN
jgi:hypothetical protein